MAMGAVELKDILEKHKKWARGEAEGQRADLQGADLQGAYLRGADLRGADLRGAYLQGADLRGADLRGADLRGAYLRGADLRGADLQGAYLQGAYLQGADLRGAYLQGAKLDEIKNDFFERMALAKGEVVGLYDAIMRGRIDGTSYKGECACFVGTIANIRKENYRQLRIDLRPDSDSPTEKWFLAILKGDTPQSNQVADITAEWIEEFALLNLIDLPDYKLVSSAEFPAAFA